MTYNETINTLSLKYAGRLDEEIPREVLEHAVSLRTDGPKVELPGLHLETLSNGERRLFDARVLGGMYTRLAVVSDALATRGVIERSVFEMHLSDQEAVLTRTAQQYAKMAEQFLDEAGWETRELLNPGFITECADPLNNVPHSFVREKIAQTKRGEKKVSDHLRSIVSYANVLPGTFPPRHFPTHPIGENDSLYVQAFGRRSVFDRELPEVRDLHETSEDVFEAFERLAVMEFEPGLSNEALADVIDARLGDKQVIETVVQWEVAYSLWKKNPERYRTFEKYIHVVWPSSGFYPTYEVKADSIKVADKVGLYNPLELAHPDMAIRALGILSKRGVEADLEPANIPYDPQSVQKQTQGKAPWVVREFLTRSEHILRNRVEF